jgi:ABC-2 type transport system ATP-binding protein
MREGSVLADDTPDALRTRTGSATVEEAFLHLVDEATADEATARQETTP